MMSDDYDDEVEYYGIIRTQKYMGCLRQPFRVRPPSTVKYGGTTYAYLGPDTECPRKSLLYHRLYGELKEQALAWAKHMAETHPEHSWWICRGENGWVSSDNDGSTWAIESELVHRAETDHAKTS